MSVQSINPNSNWKGIFQTVGTQIPSTNNSKGNFLSNCFSSSIENPSVSVCLTLNQDKLFLSQVSKGQSTPFGQVSLSFDLKFDVHHQRQKDLKSAKIGFRLYVDEGFGCSFYGPSDVIEKWVSYLQCEIHQKGFHERFKPIRILGKGNFATVYEVARIEDGKKFAVKAFSKQNCFSTDKGKQSLANELSVMRTLSKNPHQNVLQLEGVFESDNSIYVVLQLLAGGQLFHRIKERNGLFTSAQVRECIWSLLSGMSKMHQHRIAHRDLKPENIMCKNAFSLESVIVDFGLACHADEEKYLFTRCGTPGFVAPEIISLGDSQHVEPECDVFSLGVIFHILLTKKALFEGKGYNEVYKKNKEMDFKLQGALYKDVEPEAMDLLNKMLIADPKQRITANKALRHCYFDVSNEGDVSIFSPARTAATKK